MHPEAPPGSLRELEQRVVLGQGEVVLGSEVLVEHPLEAGVGGQEVAPRPDARVPWGEGAGDSRCRSSDANDTEPIVDSATTRRSP